MLRIMIWVLTLLWMSWISVCAESSACFMFQSLESDLADGRVDDAEMRVLQLSGDPEATFLTTAGLTRLGRYYLNISNFNLAEHYFYKAFSEDNHCSVFPEDQARLIRIELELGNMSRARLFLGRLLKYFPQYSENAELIAAVKRQGGFTDTCDVFLSGSDAVAYCNQLYENSDYKMVQQFSQDALARKRFFRERPAFLTLLGMSHYLQGQGRKSVDLFSEVLERYAQSPDAAKARFYLGRYYLANGDLDSARLVFERVIARTSPFTPSGYYYLYRVYKAKNNVSGYAPWFQQFKRKYRHTNYFNRLIWDLGWQSWQEGQGANAHRFFSMMSDEASDFYLKAKILYWDAKALEKAGDLSGARALLARCYSRYPMTYFSYRIAESSGLGMKTSISETIPKTPRLDGDMEWWIANNRPDMALNYVRFQYNHTAAKPELISVQRELLFSLAYMYQLTGDYTGGIRVVQDYFSVPHYPYSDAIVPQEYYSILYPMAHWNTVKECARREDLDPLFVLAVMRKESSFKPKVKSRSGAMGLMQIMPATGREIAQKLGMAYPGDEGVMAIETNIRFGTWYLGRLMRSFEGKFELALSGYNAGPGRTRKWIQTFGGEDMDNFVANIQYSETQNYVVRIMEMYWTYRLLYRGR